MYLFVKADRFFVDIFSKNDKIYLDPSYSWIQRVDVKGVWIMFNKEVVVRCESGLHNRQATYFVQKANEFDSSIWLESENRKMNAKSLLGIMSLGIVTGSTVNLSAYGPDAEAAVNALEALLQRDVY